MSTTPPQASGVYQIRCITTGKVYVGSAVNVYQRWSHHQRALNRGRHKNKHLQAAWSKHGEDSFVFEVLEISDRSTLLVREQAWMDRLKSRDKKCGFNIFDAGSPRDALAKVWEGFIDPEGNEVTIVNLQEFCRQHGLDHPSMIRLYQGRSKLKSYKGWTHRNSQRKREFVNTYTSFISPDGQHVGPITNLAAFCRERGLEKSHMVAVAHGRLCSHQGWTYDKGKQRQQKIHVGFISPEGEHVRIANLAAFCRQHGLHPVHMHQLKNGQRRVHKGWTWRRSDDSPA